MKNKLVALIVDDSKLIAERLLNLLHETPNIEQAVLGYSYEEGKKLLDEKKIDVVLLDINLPDKSGVELLQYIKKMEYPVKVIIVSNETNPLYKEICMKLGAFDYFDKSIEFEKLKDLIETL